MAADPNDIFAEFRTGAPARPQATPQAPQPTAQSQDIFSEFRVDQRAPQISREANTLGEEFVAGLGGGIDSLQGSLFGVAALTGRELGINWMEQAGMEGAAKNFEEAGENARESTGFTDIESAGGFFKWSAASIGEAIPSLAAAMTGGGAGAALGKKAVELGVKKSLARSVERRLVGRYGFGREEALLAAREYMLSDTGKTALARAVTGPRTSAVIGAAAETAGRRGAAAGAVAVSALPQIGAIDQELLRSGVADPGLTALLGGIAGGALEAAPALRLLDKMFPGVDKQVSKQFVKDFAVSTGTQAALEGSTEAAQEIIQLAALAYKDPTFDMFSPDAKKRVIDAFAAGTLVGTVTGGLAEGSGAVTSGARRAAAAVPPAIGAWRMTAEQKVEEALPEGFVAADNTLFQEVKGRVYSAVQPHIESAVNSLQAQVDKVTASLNENLDGGVNAETAKLADIARAAHNKFLQDHGDQIQQAKDFMDTQVERITRAAREIKDPEARARFVEEQTQSVRERLSGFVDMIRRKAAERDQKTTVEVDNMDFDDDLLEQLGVEIEQEETERRVGPSGRRFDRPVGPEVQQESPVTGTQDAIQTGETEAEPVIIWGRNQKRSAVTVDGKETVVGYKTKADAEKGRGKLRQRFLRSNKRADLRKQDDLFRIVRNPQGDGWVIEAIDPDMREAQKFFDDLDAARDSARRTKSNERNNARKFSFPIDGKKFGYADTMETMNVDMKTMAFRGRNLDPNAKTMEDGFLAMASEMISRGIMDTATFEAMNEKFQEHFGDAAQVEIDEFTTVTKFPPAKNRDKPDGVAKANMVSFIDKMEARGIKIPFNLLNTVQNEDGTFSWGIDDVRTFRALRTRSPEDAQTILDGIKNERRQETLADASREAREFSGNIVLDAGGDLGDPTGARAGAPDVEVIGRSQRNTLPLRKTDPDLGPSELEFGTSDTAVEGAIGRETKESQTKTDKKTDPDKLPSEFDTPSQAARLLEGDVAGRRTRRANQNARELSQHDRKLLKRWGRPGNVKVLFGPGVSSAVTKGVTDLANFVTKKLGLSNQITVIDDTGLKLLIDQGAVNDPVFAQTLNDPSVHARNIRVNDNSFVYLSGKVLSDPTSTVLAFGHEMGHHVYRVAWDGLTEAGRGRLRKAFGDGTDAEFNEWMADQLAAWITQRQAPKNQVEAFFAKVGGQIRRLYDFIKGRERFQLDETFAEFADAVAMRARNDANTGANPFNDAILKSWFKNEGVTMYEWFGQALEQDNMDFTPVTEQSQQALARMERAYPAIVKRAVTLRNWVVSAYKLAVAPSTSAIRTMAQHIPAAGQLVTIFNRQAQGARKIKQNYHQGVELMRGQFMEQYTRITKGVEAEIKARRPDIKNAELQTLVNAEMRKIGKSLQQKDGNPGARFTAREQAVRDLFDAAHAYALEAGLPVRKVVNYFPRQFSRELLIANKQKILDYLTNNNPNRKGMPLDKARHLYNSLIDPHANDGRATFDATETPGFKAMNSRQVQDKWFDQFLDDNTDGIVANYINQVVKRAEFNRHLGEAMPATNLDARQAIKKGLWDPKGKMHGILGEAKRQGATDEELVLLEKYIDANLGQLGRDSALAQPGMRKFMAAVMAYQNMRVLLFTVFASLPDLVGPSIRGGGMKAQWGVLKNEIGNIAKNDSALADMARAYGIIQDTASEHIMTEYVDNHYMPPKLRKWNDNFFKYTGLNWYTDFTRKMALATGIDYLEQSYTQFLNGDAKVSARGKDMLAELGVTPGQVATWLRNGKPTYDSQSHEADSSERKIAEALVQFVDESIMRPNASQRPILASHPGAMLVYHLKGYMYAVHDIILKRIKFNIDEAESPAQYAAAIAPALAMMLLTAVGLELRELIQYAGSNRKPPTDRMDGWEYTWELAQRSGLTGFAQIGFDLEGAEDRGMSHVAGIGGPALSQVGDWLSKPHTQTIPKAIPIISQIPALRDATRTVL